MLRFFIKLLKKIILCQPRCQNNLLERPNFGGRKSIFSGKLNNKIPILTGIVNLPAAATRVFKPFDRINFL